LRQPVPTTRELLALAVLDKCNVKQLLHIALMHG